MSERCVRWTARGALLAVLLMCVSDFTIADPDMFHGLAVFREALEQGAVPTRDVFAYTPTVAPVVHHEWLTGGLVYLVSSASGLGAAGLMLLKYALTLGVAVAVFLCARRRGASEPLILFLAPLAILLGEIGFTTLRAQLVTLFFIGILLCLIEEDRRGRRSWIVAWLPLYVLWLNMHAGFVVGVGLLGLYAMERGLWDRPGSARRAGAAHVSDPDLSTRPVLPWHLALVFAGMVCLLPLNPYGWDYAVYIWHAVRLDRSLIIEWNPLWRCLSPGWALSLFATSLVPVVVMAVRRGPRQLPGFLMVCATAYLALRHVRHGSIYAVVWLTQVPSWLEGTDLSRGLSWFWTTNRRAVLAGSLTCGLLCLGSAVSNRFWELTLPTTEPRSPINFPAGAVRYLAEQDFRGNVMTPFQVGAFLSWRLHPHVRISFDGRYEVAFPPEALVENRTFYKGLPGWREILDRYDTDAVLAPRTSPLDGLLEDLPDWRRVYRDDSYSLFVRTPRAEALATVDRSGQPIPMSFP